MQTNPLLDFTGMPRFSEIKPEFVTPAIDTLLKEARDTITNVCSLKSDATWDSVIEPLTDVNERLERSWGMVSYLKNVVNNPELKEVYDINLPKISEFSTEYGQNAELCNKFKQIESSSEFESYIPARKKIIENQLIAFKLAGVDLESAKKERFMEIEKRISDLENTFDQNELESTDDFVLIIEDKNELRGIPEDVLEMYAEEAKASAKTGYKITLQGPSCGPVMQYCENRALREKIYKQNVTLASEFGPEKWDNTPIIRERLKLCKEEAALLGYKNYGDVSVVTKMAETTQEVKDFLRKIAAHAKPFAVKDKDLLESYAKEKLNLPSLESWDLSYVSEKLRIEKYSYSDNEVKQYFSEAKVVEGLFNLVKKLYKIDIRKADAPVWHKDAKYYEILKDGVVIAGFYFDLYARANKQSGAWMDSARGRKAKNGLVQTPIAYLTCNFSKPVGDKPALFTHDEVTTLFHEFGHGLQHMLTKVDDLGVSGINGVEWDAVELPSQMMENFCWEWDVVSSMTEHVETKKPLSRELFDKMLAAKNFCSGMQLVRHVEFSLFDMILYTEFDEVNGDWNQLRREIMNEVAVFFPPEYNRFPNTFGHIFAGGYAAGYYSYLWAEVLSADAYSAFDEAGGANAATGEKFLREVLEVGGSRTSAESFKSFRGRAPEVDALLRYRGLVETKK